MFFFTSVVLFFCLLAQSNSLKDGYYWKEYLGSIPFDALVVGLDEDGNDIFAGQAYIRGAGLITGRILPGAKYEYVPYNSFVNLGKYIKVLCGTQQNFYWLPVNLSNLLLKIANKHTVVGGHDDHFNNYLAIGRVKIKNETKIGKLTTDYGNNTYLYYIDDDLERKVAMFEVLIYKED